MDAGDAPPARPAVIERLRALAATTPGRYRLWSSLLAGVLVLVLLAGTAAGARLRSTTATLRDDTGPVLVATQTLVASLAEADGAATAVFLSAPVEDREQRRLYEEAVARSLGGIERISALIGDDDELHAVLTDIAVAVARYTGLVEASRAAARAGAGDAATYLVQALDVLGGEVAADVRRLTEATRDRLRRDEGRRDDGVPAAVAVGGAALAGLVAVQVALVRRSRRILNPPLVLATLLLLVAVGWTVVGSVASAGRLRDARHDAFASIEASANVQATGHRARTDETVALITGDAARRASADAAAGALLAGEVGGDAGVVEAGRSGRAPDLGGHLGASVAAADSPRERAAVAELLVRWLRYRDAVGRLRAAPPAEQARVAQTDLNATFNGFNFSVESVLVDNRDQFLAGLGEAVDDVSEVPTASLLLPVVALALALFGLQLRIAEYR